MGKTKERYEQLKELIFENMSYASESVDRDSSLMSALGVTVVLASILKQASLSEEYEAWKAEKRKTKYYGSEG